MMLENQEFLQNLLRTFFQGYKIKFLRHEVHNIQARENETNFFASGVYLVGREFAGSERGATPLGAVPPFDLAVIDEAYEIFAGLTMLHLARLLRAPEPADCGISLVRRGQGIHNRTGQRAHGVTALPATVLAHPALADIRRPPSGPDASFPMAHRGRGKEALVKVSDDARFLSVI